MSATETIISCALFIAVVLGLVALGYWQYKRRRDGTGPGEDYHNWDDPGPPATWGGPPAM